MTNIKHPDNMDFVRSGQEYLSASGYNGLIQAARSSMDTRYGESNGADLSGGASLETIRYWMNVQAHANIPVKSIFTIQSNGESFSLVEPTPKTEQISAQSATSCVWMTNPDYALVEGSFYYLPVLSLSRPFIFRYDPSDGTPSVGTEVGPKLNTYDMSADSDIGGFTAVSAADAANFLVWAIKTACGSGGGSVLFDIPMFEFIEPLYPGYTAKARKLMWDTATTTYVLNPSDTTEYILFDPEEQNMFLPKDRVHGMEKKLKNAQSENFCDYEIVGEHGLHRKVKVQNNLIECSASGEVKVMDGTQRQHPPPKAPTTPSFGNETDPICEGAVFEAPLISCNVGGWRRRIMPEEVTTTHWDVSRQAWVFVQEDRASVLEAYATQGGICPSEQNPALTGAQFMDWQADPCSLQPDPDITEGRNIHKLACKENASITLVRQELAEGPDEWTLVEVGHVIKPYVKDIKEKQGELCPNLEYIEEVSIMTCKEDAEKDFGVPATVLSNMDINSQSCEFAVSEINICVLGTGTPTPKPIATMTQIEVLTDVVTGSDCAVTFPATKICAFVIGPGTAATLDMEEMDVVTGVDPVSNCGISLTTTTICAINKGAGTAIEIPLDAVDVVTGVSVSKPGQADCKIEFDLTKVCGVLSDDPPGTKPEIPITYTTVGKGISDSSSCVYLDKVDIPIIGGTCVTEDAGQDKIYCVIDCEDTPTTVLPIAEANGSYSPLNKQTQPYDPTNTTSETDITIVFPDNALEGEIIAVANDTNSDKPITIDGNGNSVQNIQAPYTTATSVIWGARLSITYQLRKVGTGPAMAWRIV